MKKLINKQITVITHNKDALLIFADSDEIRIDYQNSAWRLINNGQILVSSADVQADFAYYMIEEATDFLVDKYSQKDEAVFEKIDELREGIDKIINDKFNMIENLLADKIITNADKTSLGDISLTFSNGVILEIIKMSKQKI